MAITIKTAADIEGMRIAGRLDTIRDTIATAIQVTLSMVAIDENEINKQLAAYAAIFAVFTAFAGIWGMNFEFMPELKWKYGYPMAITLMSATTLAMLFYFYRKGWIGPGAKQSDPLAIDFERRNKS